MGKRQKDLGTPTVVVRFAPITPECLAENRRIREEAVSAVESRRLGFPVIATTLEGPQPDREPWISHGGEVVYPNRMDPEKLPEWAKKALAAFPLSGKGIETA